MSTFLITAYYKQNIILQQQKMLLKACDINEFVLNLNKNYT